VAACCLRMTTSTYVIALNISCTLEWISRGLEEDTVYGRKNYSLRFYKTPHCQGASQNKADTPANKNIGTIVATENPE
jgi:hypothetical protein